MTGRQPQHLHPTAVTDPGTAARASPFRSSLERPCGHGDQGGQSHRRPGGSDAQGTWGPAVAGQGSQHRLTFFTFACSAFESFSAFLASFSSCFAVN